MVQLPTGTVTFLFTDIEGSTRLLQELGRERFADALGAHRRLLREAAEQHGGVEVEMQGDSFHFAFATAGEAVAGALAAQQALAGHAWEGEPIRVRMGVHSGTPVIAEDLYTGLDVHRAARIMNAAHGGQVVLSQVTRSLIESDLPSGASIADLGLHRLKDLLEPQHLFQLEIEGLETEFPVLRTLENRVTNLPVQPTPFIGRERELAELLELASSVRLLTLTGAGGAGKTRLALQTGAELVENYPDGVWWVPLAAVRDAELVEPTIAQVVGAKNGLAEHLRPQRALLVLDNLEQLLPVAPRISALLAEAPELKVLATSRARLGLAAEREYAVPTMAPDEALELFAVRTPHLQRDPETDATVAEICRRLDRLPLAIELAAARAKLLRPAQILERIEHRLELLTGGARDAEERHQTLRATIGWSYELLSDPERRLFRRLAVFAGGCTLEAAEEVCEAELDTLASLLDKSLIGHEGTRFTMLESIREYATEGLEASGFEAGELRRRHAEWFATLAEQAHDPLVTGDQVAWFERLEEEHDNIREALRWSLEGADPQPGLRLCAALRPFWFPHGYFVEAGYWLDLATSRADEGSPAVRARVLGAAGYLAVALDDGDKALPLLERALTVAREGGDQGAAAYALVSLAILARTRHDLDGAIELAEEALSLSREVGDANRISVALHQLANFLSEADEHSRARELFEESIRLDRERGDLFSAANTMHSLGDLALDAGDLDGAEELYSESLGLAQQFEADWVAVYCLAGLASVAAGRGELDRAARIWGAVEELERGLGIVAMLPSAQDLYANVVRPACEAAPDALAAGRELDLDAAIAAAVNAG